HRPSRGPALRSCRRLPACAVLPCFTPPWCRFHCCCCDLAWSLCHNRNISAGSPPVQAARRARFPCRLPNPDYTRDRLQGGSTMSGMLRTEPLAALTTREHRQFMYRWYVLALLWLVAVLRFVDLQ